MRAARTVTTALARIRMSAAALQPAHEQARRELPLLMADLVVIHIEFGPHAEWWTVGLSDRFAWSALRAGMN